MEGRTVIVVAHRLSTIRDVDPVHVSTPAAPQLTDACRRLTKPDQA